jgi:hypothetical protein
MNNTYRNIPFSKLALVLALCLGSSAQADWIKAYGTSNMDIGIVTPAATDGYFLSLSTSSLNKNTKSLSLLSKLDSNGDPEWTKQITTGNYDHFYLSQTSDHRILLQGDTRQTTSSALNSVLALFDIDSASGQLTPVFSKVYKKGASHLSFMQDDQGVLWGLGSIVTSGQTGKGSDMILANINAKNGIPNWSKVFHYSTVDSVRSILSKGQNYILVANSHATPNNQKILIGLLNKTGEPVSGSFNEYAGTGLNEVMAIKAIAGGNYVLYGTSKVSNTSSKASIFVLKLDANLKALWEKNYSAGTDQGFIAPSVDENADGTLTITSQLMTTDKIAVPGLPGMTIPMPSTHPAVIKLSADGAVISAKTLAYQNDTAFFTKNTDSSYLISGQTMTMDFMSPSTAGNSNILYGQFTADLSPVWTKTFGGTKTDMGGIISQGNGYNLFGSTMSWGAGNIDVLAGQLDANGDVANCDFIKEVDMLENALTVKAENLNWTPKSATLTKKGVISSSNITLNVSDGQLTTTKVCGN